MAKGIYRAFLNYKREHELRLTGVSKTIVPTEQEEDNAPANCPKGYRKCEHSSPTGKAIGRSKNKTCRDSKTAPKRPIVGRECNQ